MQAYLVVWKGHMTSKKDRYAIMTSQLQLESDAPLKKISTPYDLSAAAGFVHYFLEVDAVNACLFDRRAA